MKIRVMSDLHLEFTPLAPPHCEVDVVILAGDIDLIERASVPSWAKRAFPGTKVIWVLGNHEYYSRARSGMDMKDLMALAREQVAEVHGVRLLENESVFIGDVRFLGCSLWTDFRLHGSKAVSMEAAGHAMADFRGAIQVRGRDGKRRRFTPQDSVKLHRASRKWLDDELAKHFDGKTVVVTHHTPSAACEHRAYANSPLSPAFNSNLDGLILKHQPAYWISGHTHASHRVQIGNTVLLSNQRGYRDTPEHEDAPFDPNLVIEA